MNVKHEDFPDCDVDVELPDRYKISPAIRMPLLRLRAL